MKRASLDLGTNSFLCTIAEVESGEVVEVYEDQMRIVRLGQGVDGSGALHPEAQERALEALREFRGLCEGHGIALEEVRSGGTSALRDARDREAFVERVRRETGFAIEVISGAQEAWLSYRGALSSLPLGEDAAPCLLDIGGGSTELVWAGGEHRHSLNIGVVRAREKYLLDDPPTASQLGGLGEELRGALEALPERPVARPLLAVAGTPTTLVAIEKQLESYDGSQVHGARLSLAQLGELLERLSSMSLEERKGLAGLHPKRADLIVGGALILKIAMEFLGQEELWVSDRGLRYGLLLD